MSPGFESEAPLATELLPKLTLPSIVSVWPFMSRHGRGWSVSYEPLLYGPKPKPLSAPMAFEYVGPKNFVSPVMTMRLRSAWHFLDASV